METFFKYHGLGNDFVVLDRRASGQDIDAERSKALCDRHFGLGADGVLTILPSLGAAGRMVVHNADGSVAEMCGNGLRCVVKHVAERLPDRPSALEIDTGAGRLRSELDWGPGGVERISVDMGPARLVDPSLPKAPGGGRFVHERLDGLLATAVSLGNPHLVLLEEPPEQAARLGPDLERHPAFPHRTNVEFVRVRKDGGLDVTVYERGVGLTLACGTGACAAVVAFALELKVAFDAWVPVRLPGGELFVRVAADLEKVELKGPAAFVYEGKLA